MNENKNTTTNKSELQEVWFKPVNRVGQITIIIAMIACFFPFLYLYITYGMLPEGSEILAGILSIFSAYGVGYIIEPIMVFPSLGTAGTYMGVLAGSMLQMRVPAALMAKNVAGVEDDTQEAEIVATCGVAGSVFMNCFVLFVTAVAGQIILSALPKVILNILSAYVLPAIFGAVLAMFTSKGKMPITIPAVILTFALNLLNKAGYYPLPAWTLLILGLVIGVSVARVCYKQNWAY